MTYYANAMDAIEEATAKGKSGRHLVKVRKTLALGIMACDLWGVESDQIASVHIYADEGRIEFKKKHGSLDTD